MIGFSLPVTIYDAEGNDTREVVLLSLDLDSFPDRAKPDLDLRLAKNDDIIVNCTVEDAYQAIWEIRSQLNEWERKLSPAAVASGS